MTKEKEKDELLNSTNKKIHSYRDPKQNPQKLMSTTNFSKYLIFLNSSEHFANETSNKKKASPEKTLPKHRQNSYNTKINEFDLNLKADSSRIENSINPIGKNETSIPKAEEGSSLFPRVKTIRKSILNENLIMEKMFLIAKKVMKNLKKLEKLNNNNKIKTYNELNKLFNGNAFLNGIFFNSSGKEMNPKLSESFIAHSVCIYPSKFNRNPLENKIKYNFDGIKVLESLSEKIKEFCFNKKLLELQSEEKDIVDLQKALKKIEQKYIRKPNSTFWQKIQIFATTIEAPPQFNSQISKMLKHFEERYGRLDKVKEKSKIVGERVDVMMQELYEKFVQINNKI